VAAGPRVDPARWRAEFEDAFALVAGRFAGRPARLRAKAYLQGLLSQTERKNGWTIAEHAGDVSPDGMQRLLNFYAWDADAVRDDVRGYVIDRLGHPDGVLVVDETGFIKKGTRSAGVQRQYSGTAGRIENCQLGVFLSYASPCGRALIDRELYLPASWTCDRARCAEAGVPERVGFATKPQLAQAMIERADGAGVPFGWVAADEAYGNNPGLRGWLEDHQLSYLMAVSCSFAVATHAGHHRADALVADLPKQAWQRLSAGDGAKGPRLYDWALIDTVDSHQVLLRRSIADPGEVAYYICWAPHQVPLRELVRIAGARWAIEECFQAAKNEVGLDHYQVRKYHAWYRHITLAVLAHALLAAIAASKRSASQAEKGAP